MDRKVLLIEDESLIREIVADYFKREQWIVYEAENGLQGLEMMEKLDVDLIILDILMPELDGWAVCKRIRAQSAVPIIMLTAKSEDDDKMLGFELGADDYVTKPFSPKVLVARAVSLMKRVEGTVGKEEHLLNFGKISIHRRSHRVEVDGQEIELTAKEYELLLYLSRNEGIVLSRETILDHVWGFDYFGDLRVVDTHIKKLRGKLGDEARHIRTVIRSGYKFEEER
ncbi:response regulator transcription factor [Paenibacillus sp. N3.4]|uniref:response regulator transcription factor n=1 Tax=Paenibacillus sp. N3.4 TaxID=2603222 RepID=UPI0011C71F06|nr:response regulator transcription factor [Paenibacillus sp. N3.4]TXK82646.1 response regulator transcription factor [Paenibacillus sp. N3.4]